jgi:hypothetical protein
VRPFALGLVGLLVVAGCSSGPLVRDAPDLATPAEFPNHSAAQIVTLMSAQAGADSLVAFSSQAKVAVRTPDRNADLSATIRQRAADTLWATARGPFGIEVARARATPDSFAVHDKLNDRLYVGATAAAAAFLPTPVDTHELFATLLGSLRPDGSGAGWTVRVDGLSDGERYYTLADAAGRHVFVVDPSTWRTVRYEGYVDGVLIDERTFSAFDRIDGRILPRRVEIRNPQAETGLMIEHRRLSLNPVDLSFPFSPGDAEVERLPCPTATC